MNAHQRADDAPRLAIVVKGYPRLSETFIAQEMLGLEQRGFDFDIWSLRHPTDGAVHMLHQMIKARPYYLPEYVWQGPLRLHEGHTGCSLWQTCRPVLGILACSHHYVYLLTCCR